MTLFDVNILIYAHREDQKDHLFYRGKSERPLGFGGKEALGALRDAMQADLQQGKNRGRCATCGRGAGTVGTMDNQ